MTEDAIAVDRLAVERGGRPVLRGLTFTVPRCTVTGLLGPSGGGKTTLMRSIVGVQRTKSGTVTVLGEPAGSPALRPKIGYVTQAPSVYADLTIAENVAYFAALYGVNGGDQVLRDVGLADRGGDRVGNLSGGQRARASLACALVARPELLVLDEPTVGLDPVLRRDLWQLFHGLADDGATLLISSHVMDEADRCERLLLLRDGELVADDTPDELRRTTGSDNIEEAFLRIAEGASA